VIRQCLESRGSAGGAPLAEHPGPEAARGPARDAALPLVGPAEVQVLADHLLEEDPAGERPVQDLREAALELQDRAGVPGAGPAIRRGEGVREPGEPLPEQGRELRGREPVREGLEPAGVGAGLDAVIEGVDGDPPLGELPLQVLVAVAAERGGGGEGGADLQDEGADVLVAAVDGVVVDQGRVPHDPRVALAGGRALPLLRAAHRRLLRGLAEDHPAVRRRDAGQVRGHHGVLPLAGRDGEERHARLGGDGLEGAAERLTDRFHARRRGERVAPVDPGEPRNPALVLAPGDVDVRAPAITALDFQGPRLP